MNDQYPYVRNIEIVRCDGRKDRKVKSVKMTIYTAYNSEEPHLITFVGSTDDVEVKWHNRDYGKSVQSN